MCGLQAGELRHDVARVIRAFQLLIGTTAGYKHPAVGCDYGRGGAGVGGQLVCI